MAYFTYHQFALIDENGGYFVGRLKRTTKPEIAAELREWRKPYCFQCLDMQIECS